MKKTFLFATLSLALLVAPLLSFAQGDVCCDKEKVEIKKVSLSDQLRGRILLQVESKGEAWYIYPNDNKRYYLGRPQDAFDIMRNTGVGITDSDLDKIPTYNNYAWDANENIVNRVEGKILLQVEQNGEAWYVSPVNNRRYYMGRPADAFQLMRNLGLGISNKNLTTIKEGYDSEQAAVDINLSAEAKSDGVHFSWDIEGSLPSGFKIVGSEQSDPTYPEAEYKKYISSSTQEYIWKGLPDKTLYFRVGAYQDGSCYAYSDNVIVNPIDGGDDSTLPVATNLSATIDSDGVHLAWDKNSDSSFKYNKVVRSESNPEPTYPADGYINVASRDQITYLDKEVNSNSSGTYYYSICTVNSYGQVIRSNVIKIVDGVTQ